jgi:S1-C subfamily serine protease
VAEDDPAGDPVVLLGYPNDGPLTAVAATAGKPRKVLAPDAYGRNLRLRTIVPLRGEVEHGESGGPIVDEDGEVVAMVFAAATEGEGGFGVPLEAIERGLEAPLEPTSTGPCA